MKKSFLVFTLLLCLNLGIIVGFVLNHFKYTEEKANINIKEIESVKPLDSQDNDYFDKEFIEEMIKEGERLAEEKIEALDSDLEENELEDVNFIEEEKTRLELEAARLESERLRLEEEKERLKKLR